MSAPKSPAERKRSERERKRDAGLVKVEVWVRPDQAEKVKSLEVELRAEG